MRSAVRRREGGGREEAPRVEAPVRQGARVLMSRALRGAVLSMCALLWLSGALWLVLHLAFAQRNEFGAVPNPWEPSIMRLHGVLAVGAVFLFGWITADHTLERWGSGRNRASGLALAASAVLLVASGYALYYTVGPVHEVAALTHRWLGALSILAALTHWRRIRKLRGSP